MNKSVPKHVAIVMDGNGRWAKKRGLPRVAGHKAGLDAVRSTIEAAIEGQVEVLSLFAFSSENWQRPASEVTFLQELFATALSKEVKLLHENNVRIKFIGDRTAFSTRLQQSMSQAESLTKNNVGLKLVIATNYGGRWDIANACRQIARQVALGALDVSQIDESLCKSAMALSDLPEPDLFIRTSGEIRLSNFFLWQLAYTELYFTEVYWPDFNKKCFQQALEKYAQRKRRFGLITEQLEES